MLRFRVIAIAILQSVLFVPSAAVRKKYRFLRSSASDALLAADRFTNDIEENKLDLISLYRTVKDEMHSNHPELYSCLTQVENERDIAIQLAGEAKTNWDQVRNKNQICQDGKGKTDKTEAKQACREVEEAAEKCKDSAILSKESLRKAQWKYFYHNRAAAHSYESEKLYRELKHEYDMAVNESRELSVISRKADIEAETSGLGRRILLAENIRAQKNISDTYMPGLPSKVAYAYNGNYYSQYAASLWNEYYAWYYRERVIYASTKALPEISQVRTACKNGRDRYYKFKIRENRKLERQVDEIFRMREELLLTIGNIVADATSENSTYSENTDARTFGKIMKSLLESINEKLRTRLPKKKKLVAALESETQTYNESAPSLGQFLEDIFRPVPPIWEGSIYDEETHSCLTTLRAFRKVYYNQIEILQRGLPTPLLQHQFSQPFSRVDRVDDETCIEHKLVDEFFTADWYLRDTLVYGGLLELDELQENHGKEFPFLSFLKVPKETLPKVDEAKMTEIDELWNRTVSHKNSLNNQTSSANDVYFPRTIELLYDDDKSNACVDYQKFGPLQGPGTVNARRAVTMLLASAVRVVAMGGSKSSVSQMLANLSAFIFNGVRCMRMEGVNIRIPKALLKAYSKATASIIGEIEILQDDPKISTKAIKELFWTEIEAITSFDTWGNSYFHAVYPDGHYDHITFIDALYEEERYKKLLAIVQQDEVESAATVNGTVRQDVCGQQFRYEEDILVKSHAKESCCAGTCDLMNTMDDCVDLYLICCERCNEYLCLATTVDEMANLPNFTVIVPEYGERYPFAVPIMI